MGDDEGEKEGERVRETVDGRERGAGREDQRGKRYRGTEKDVYREG